MTIHHLPLCSTTSRRLLAGRLLGQADLALVLAALPTTPAPTVVIDLAGAEAITSSYFTAALLPLWSLRVGLYPVLAGISLDFEDDVVLPLRQTGTLAWIGEWTGTAFTSARAVGLADDEARRTLDAVARQGAATAASLFEADSTIGRTAWSNRLAALYDSRLLRRVKDERQLVYSLPWVEVKRG